MIQSLEAKRRASERVDGDFQGRGVRPHRDLDGRVKRRLIEDFPMRFAAVATDLATGEVRIFNARRSPSRSTG